MSNRIDNYPLKDDKIVLQSSRTSNTAATASVIFDSNKFGSASQATPLCRFVDISTAIVARLNQPNIPQSKSLIAQEVGSKFREYADNWYAETRRDSSITRILSNENYLRVIELGTAVIPFILEELRQRPRPWFLVLRVLTKNEEVGKGYPGNFEKMAEAWINWGKERGLTK